MQTHWSEVLRNIATTFAIFVGGWWTLWKFVISRERYPKPEFSLDIVVLGKSTVEGAHLVELSALVRNKSSIRLIIPHFAFSLFYLQKGQELKEGDERINNMVQFKRLIKERLWLAHLAEKDEYTFVDAGTEQRFSYVTALPGNAEFALLQSKFTYTELESEWHSAQKCVAIH